MNEVYKIIDNITDEIYKKHLKDSFDSFFKAKNNALIYVDGLVSALCWYGIDAGMLSELDGRYISDYIHENAELRLKYHRKKHK